MTHTKLSLICIIAFASLTLMSSAQVTNNTTANYTNYTVVNSAFLPVGGGDWTSLIPTPQDSRYQPNSTINSSNIGSLKESWFIKTKESVTSTPVVLTGNVYFADWSGQVYSANVSTGSVNWKVNLIDAPISSTPTLANGLVYVTAGFGKTKVFALKQKNGHVVWETKLNTTMDAIWASPMIYNGILYTGVASAYNERDTNAFGAIFALNATTGKVLWHFTTSNTLSGSGSGVWGSAVYDPVLDSIYFATGNPFGSSNSPAYGYSIISLNALNGKFNWAYTAYNSTTIGQDQDFGSSVNLFSLTYNGLTYNAVGIGGKDGIYYIVNRNSGALIKTFKVGTWPYGHYGGGGIIGISGFLYENTSNTISPEIFIPSYTNQSAPEYNGVVEALIPSTNTVAWRFKMKGIPVGSVSLIPGAVLVGDENGDFYAINTTTGNQVFNTIIPGVQIDAGITSAEGHIFVPASYGSSKSYNGVYAYTTT